MRVTTLWSRQPTRIVTCTHGVSVPPVEPDRERCERTHADVRSRPCARVGDDREHVTPPEQVRDRSEQPDGCGPPGNGDVPVLACADVDAEVCGQRRCPES